MTRHPHPLLYLFAAVHAVVGTYVLYVAVTVSFAGPWMFVAVGGPLLVANAIGSTMRREAFDRKLSRGLAMTMRVGGGLALVAGAMAMTQHLDGAWTVVGVSLAIAGWGVAFAHVLEWSDAAFAPD